MNMTNLKSSTPSRSLKLSHQLTPPLTLCNPRDQTRHHWVSNKHSFRMQILKLVPISRYQEVSFTISTSRIKWACKWGRRSQAANCRGILQGSKWRHFKARIMQIAWVAHFRTPLAVPVGPLRIFWANEGSHLISLTTKRAVRAAKSLNKRHQSAGEMSGKVTPASLIRNKASIIKKAV